MRHRGMRLILASVLLLCSGACTAAAQGPAPSPAVPTRLRIALVPLDDRPVCLQYPQMLAGLAHAEIVAPPLELLGRFTTPGDSEAIARWLRTQDWRRIDALIVSTDMLAYGGLVASRVHAVDEATALRRLAVLEEVRAARPRLPVYGFSTIMRLAPTADGANEAYREKLARWAELAHGDRTDAESRELATLVDQIPQRALRDYTRARTRNRRVNLEAVRLVERRILDFLVVSQDDAKPRGVHLADRHAVTARVREAQAAARVVIQPGADEVAMLLLSRAVLDAHGVTPTVRATYSSARARTMVAPFEDRPLHETVSFQVATAGASEERGGTTDPDLAMFVFASRHEEGAPQAFASRIVEAVQHGTRAIVADVDPKGDVQGASTAFTEPLLAARIFPRLYGYASWNTAGNTLGTALPQGLLAWAGTRLAARCTAPEWERLADAQATFMLHRLVNDHAYQGIVRPALNAELRQAGRSSAWLDDHAAAVAARIEQALTRPLQMYAVPYTSGPWTVPAPLPTDLTMMVGPPRDLQVRLPWARTFEASITFDVPVTWSPGARQRLPACATPQ